MKYEILQLKETAIRKYGFMSYDWASKNGFDINDYEKVYEGETQDNIICPETLENLFYIFNCKHPNDYKGRSMSVSDIIILENHKFYCDDIGFKRLD